VAKSETFDRFARRVARAAGSPWTFAAVVALIATWAIAGPFLGFSTEWQLVANTFTTIVTFLMVFIIQNTQLSDTAEIKAMLREIVEDLPDVDAARAARRAQEDEACT
jgi:low affinity Fe/Cu permease